jgi:hypothetical protein
MTIWLGNLLGTSSVGGRWSSEETQQKGLKKRGGCGKI